MAGSQDTWRISGEDRSKHDLQFFQLKPVNGFVTGTQARDFFIQSGLPTPVLGQIWTLADINGDGKMDKKEFSVAMHLIKKKLQGYELPKVLPPSLKTDPSPMIGSFAQPTAGVLPMSQPIGGGIPISQPMGMGFSMGGGIGMPVGSLIQPQASLGTGTMTTGSLNLGPLMSNGAAGSFSHGTTVPQSTTMPLAAVPGSSAIHSGGGMWAMSQASKLKHTQTFHISDRNKRGYLLGVEARAILMQSGLPQQVLAQIWTLSDIDRDGKLTCDEFCISMHLAELARMGQVLPPVLPPELVPNKVGSGGITSPLPSVVVPGPPKDAFGDLLTGAGMPIPVPVVSPAQTIEDEEQVTYEDRRKENFDKGQAELERRRAILREQQQKEENERLEKDRHEVEKRERQRQEIENRRQAELQRQLEKQRDREREIEEQRRKMVEQREAARRELDRQRQMEWEKQRKEQLIAEKERESEQLRILKSQMANLRNELETLDSKKMELSLKISNVQKGVTDFTTSIDAMRNTRDKTLFDIDACDRQTMELNKTFSALSSEKNELTMQVQSAETAPLSDAYRAVANSVALKTTSIQKLRKELEKIESDKNAQMHKIGSSNTELKSLKDQLVKLERNIPQLQKNEDKLSLQKTVPQKIPQKPKTEKISQDIISTSAAVPSSNQTDNGIAQHSWFDFSSSEAISSVTAGTTSSAVIWDSAVSGTSSSASHTKHVAWNSSGITTAGGSQNKQKYRAMYDFPADREDELTLVAGMEVWVLTDFTPVPGMEDWYKGEHEGKKGWFPKAYVERLDEPSADLFGSAFEPLVQSSSVQKSDTTQLELFNSQVSQTSAISGVPTSSVESSTPNNIPPEGLLAKAIYPWKARQETDLTFDKDDVILVKEQQDMKWYGELNGKKGWFPKAYVKLTGVAPKLGLAVNIAATDQIKAVDIAGTFPLDSQGEYYVAMYTYVSDEPADLNFSEGDIICVTTTSGDWWSGTIADQGKSGIFPANYVKILEIQPAGPADSSPIAISNYDSLLGDFNSDFAPSYGQTSSNMNLMDDFFVTSNQYNVKSESSFDEIDASGMLLDDAGILSASEVLTVTGSRVSSAQVAHNAGTKPTRAPSVSFEGLGLPGLATSKNIGEPSIISDIAKPKQNILANFDQMTLNKSGGDVLFDNSLSWSSSSQFSSADTTSHDKAGVNVDLLGYSSMETSELGVIEDLFTGSDNFGNIQTGSFGKDDQFTSELDSTSKGLINVNNNKSTTVGPSDRTIKDINLDWGFEDFEKTSASKPTMDSSLSLLDDFGLIGSSNTSKISLGNAASQGNLLDLMDDFGFSDAPASATLKSSMSLPDILAVENDAIQGDLLETQNTANIMKSIGIPISASHTSSVVQVDLDVKPQKIGSKSAPNPPPVKRSLFGKLKKKTVRRY